MPVGQKLEDARKKKGISLREVSESTKIRGDYISAIETGNFEINLPEVYLRGFVRLYSKFLGLDEDAMVDELNIELGKTSDKVSKKSLGSIVAQDNKSVGKSSVAYSLSGNIFKSIIFKGLPKNQHYSYTCNYRCIFCYCCICHNISFIR